MIRTYLRQQYKTGATLCTHNHFGGYPASPIIWDNLSILMDLLPQSHNSLYQVHLDKSCYYSVWLPLLS